jgi:hypothetical protein
VSLGEEKKLKKKNEIPTVNLFIAETLEQVAVRQSPERTKSSRFWMKS